MPLVKFCARGIFFLLYGEKCVFLQSVSNEVLTNVIANET